jgi:aconitate hydratase
MRDSFKARTTLAVGPQSYEIFSLPALKGHDLSRLPFSLKILLENLLRFEDGVNVTRCCAGTRRRRPATKSRSRRRA